MDRVILANQHGVRSLPITDQLLGLLSSVGEEANVYFEVISGGQVKEHAASTKGKSWTGTHRHDDGNAADLKAFTLGPNGQRHYLDQSKPEDRQVWEQITRLSRAGGATGIGAGPDYMGNFTMHVGYGTPSVWGKDGKSANAPKWLVDAYNDGSHLPPLPIPVASKSAPTPASMTAAMAAERVGKGGTTDTSSNTDLRNALLSWANPSRARGEILDASFGVRGSTPLDQLNPGAPGTAFYDERTGAMRPMGFDPKAMTFGDRSEVGPGAGSLLDDGTARLLSPQQAIVPPTVDSTRAEQMAMRSRQPASVDRRDSGLLPGQPAALPPDVPPSPRRTPASPRSMPLLASTADDVGTGSDWSQFAAQFGMNAPQAPVPRQEPAQLVADASVQPQPAPSFARSGTVAPSPMPGRPAGLQQASASGGSTDGAQLVRLPSGKMVEVGLMPSADGQHVLQISDDGTGNALVKKLGNPGEMGGLLDPLREVNSDTIAGGLIRSQLPKVMANATDAASSNVGYAADSLKSSALDAARGFGKGIAASGVGDSVMQVGDATGLSDAIGGTLSNLQKLFGSGSPTANAPSAIAAPSQDEALAEQRLARQSPVAAKPAATSWSPWGASPPPVNTVPNTGYFTPSPTSVDGTRDEQQIMRGQSPLEALVAPTPFPEPSFRHPIISSSARHAALSNSPASGRDPSPLERLFGMTLLGHIVQGIQSLGGSTAATSASASQGGGNGGGTIYDNPTKYGASSEDRQANAAARQAFLERWNSA